jgi:KaiC/GvpD/RAD55 family RecA-like ATPase
MGGDFNDAAAAGGAALIADAIEGAVRMTGIADAERILHIVPTDLSGNVTLPEPVIDGLVPRGEVTLLAGHGGAGKSVLALTLAGHVAVGKAWCGHACEQGRVLVASLEDPGNVANFRLRRICDTYALDRDLVAENVAILDASGSDPTLAGEINEFGTVRLAETRAMTDLREASIGKKLIVVDNASDGFDGNENHRRQVRAFMRMLKEVAHENDAGLLLLAHVDKIAARHGSNGNSYSGSTGWHNSARSRLALTISEIGTVEFAQEKCQFGKLSEPISLRWTDRGVLYPMESAETRAGQPDDEAAVMAALQAAWAAGVDVGTSRLGSVTTQAALSTFRELPKSLHGARGRLAFWAALDGLVARGKVARVEIITAQRKPKWVFVDPAKCAKSNAA